MERELAVSKEELANMLTSDFFWKHRFICVPYKSGPPVIYKEPEDECIAQFIRENGWKYGIGYPGALHREMLEPLGKDYDFWEVTDAINEFCRPIEESVLRYLGMYFITITKYSDVIISFCGRVVGSVSRKDYQNWRIRNVILCNYNEYDYRDAYEKYLYDFIADYKKQRELDY